jgi:hypothetical protein
MRNFKNFKEFKNFFSTFKSNPNIQKFLSSPIAIILGINTALYVRYIKFI